MLGCDTCLQNICDKSCRLGRIWVDMIRFSDTQGHVICEFAEGSQELASELEAMGYIVTHDYGDPEAVLVRLSARNGVACISEKHDEINWVYGEESEEEKE